MDVVEICGCDSCVDLIELHGYGSCDVVELCGCGSCVDVVVALMW